jgi:hypothetical protein
MMSLCMYMLGGAEVGGHPTHLVITMQQFC